MHVRRGVDRWIIDGSGAGHAGGGFKCEGKRNDPEAHSPLPMAGKTFVAGHGVCMRCHIRHACGERVMLQHTCKVHMVRYACGTN